LMDTVAQVLPAEAAAMVRATLRQVVSNNGYRGLGSLGALTAVWAGSTGMASVMTMLNVVYDVTDHRSWLRRRVIAVLLTVVFAVFLVVSTLLLMLSARIEILGQPLATAIAVVLVLAAIDLIYYFAPAGHGRWRWVTPGSVTATALWLLASFGLRFYVAHFANYDVMYGSIGGLILFLLWLYLTSLVLLLGAEVNAAIAHAAQPDAGRTVERARSSGRVILDVVNRGNTVTVPNFNHATRPVFGPDADANPPIDVGDGFLMRRGWAVVSCGWQCDVPELPGLFRLYAPEARD